MGGENVLMSVQSDESSTEASKMKKKGHHVMWTVVWASLAALVSSAVVCALHEVHKKRVARQASTEEIDAFDETETMTLMVPVQSASAGDANENTKLTKTQSICGELGYH